MKTQSKHVNNHDFFFFRRLYNRSSSYICSIFYHGCCNRIYSSSIAANPCLRQKEDAESQPFRLFKRHAQSPYRCNAVGDPGVNLTEKEPLNQQFKCLHWPKGVRTLTGSHLVILFQTLFLFPYNLLCVNYIRQ